MPRRIVVVVGTATGIGKTWAAARLADELVRRGVEVHARKAVQSFDPSDDDRTDTDVLAAATGEDPYSVCPPHRSYPVAMAPPMAAEVLGKPPIWLSELLSEMRLPETGIVLVEGVGGPRSPLAHDADTVDLVRAIAADDIVLVADADLGAINAVLVSAAPFERDIVVFLNRFDETTDLHRRNRDWLGARGFDVITAIEDLADRLQPVSSNRRSVEVT